MMRMQMQGRPIMANKIVKIEGMSCHHCVMALRKSFRMVDGISDADVEIGVATLNLDESKVSDNEINEAVTRAGFKIKA